MNRNMTLSRSHPYQPFLLRILHGISALLVILALLTGFLVYNTYDKRWGSVALPAIEDIQGVHGTIAVAFLLLLPIFALYCFRIGHRRLADEQALRSLTQLERPYWWTALQRLVNTLMLLAATFAVLTGRMMKEEWLPAGEINHSWYLAHLVAWVCLFTGLAWHLVMGAKVGGVPLLLSMFHWTRRAADTPKSWLQGSRKQPSSLVLQVLEWIVIGGILLAFVLPAFN